ncbi:uncharacterized protein AB9X84_021850 isoform 3-T6 [Acanthopagrus schlegelii]
MDVETSESTLSPGESDLEKSGESTTSSVSFKSVQSKEYNPNFKEQSSVRVSLENQHCASTESDGRDGHTEELKEGKSSKRRSHSPPMNFKEGPTCNGKDLPTPQKSVDGVGM